jgi:Ca2+-binding EF-hand superfamily protein
MFTESVLQFKAEEVMLMSFMLLDFDNDGLISHSDLFKLLTMLDKNLLVKRTIYTILKYVKENANNQAIRDVCY